MSDKHLPRSAYNTNMNPESILQSKHAAITALCRKYAVSRLRLFGSALSESWNPDTSDFDFLADFGAPVGMDAFERYMGFVQELEVLLGRKVDVVDWNAAKNPYFRRYAERDAKELYAA